MNSIIDIQQLNNILESGDVMRFHACPRMNKQQLNSHMWSVAVICKYLKPDITADELMLALTHDSTELITGDIPATLKWNHPEVKSMIDGIETKLGILPDFKCSHDFKIILKLADFLDGLIFCYNTYIQGNKEGMIIYTRWMNALTSFCEKHELNSALLTKVNAVIDQYYIEIYGA